MSYSWMKVISTPFLLKINKVIILNKISFPLISLYFYFFTSYIYLVFVLLSHHIFSSLVVSYIFFFPLERKVRKVTKLGTFFLLYISHPQNVWYWTDVLMYLHFHLFTRGSNFHFLFFFFFFFAGNWQKHWQGCCCVHNYNVSFFFFSE